jgi:signal transduction histidine kinase
MTAVRSRDSASRRLRGVVAHSATTSASFAQAATAALRGRSAGWRGARNRVFDLEFDAEIVEIRQRLETARRRKYHHELVNAFTAVEGAALIMTREALTASDRVMLNSLLGSGLTRLRELLVAGYGEGPVALGDVVTTTALAQEGSWQDRIRVDVVPEVVVSGSTGEIGEAVRQLLIYVMGRTESGPIVVRAHRSADRVGLSVDDQGSSLSARERTEILEPHPPRWLWPHPRRDPGSQSQRAAAGGDDGVVGGVLDVGRGGGVGRLRRLGHLGAGRSDGDGRRLGPLGPLHVAVRLTRGQGGDVTVVARPQGGESFRISWPAHLD